MTFIKSLELLSDFRAKLKHVLWLGDPKAKLLKCPEPIHVRQVLLLSSEL